MSVPDPEAVRVALRALIEPGATAEQLRQQPALLALDYIVAQATGEGSTRLDLSELGQRARLILREVTSDLPHDDSDPSRGDGPAVSYLLGLAQGFGGAHWARRRDEAANALQIRPETLMHREQGVATRIERLVESFAAALVDRDVEYRLEVQRREMRRRRLPQESALEVPWIVLFQAYYRVWSPVTGLQADVDLALAAHARSDVSEFNRFAMSALYFYAKFLLRLRNFEEKCGGLWLLPQVETEQRVADAVWHISRHGPFKSYDDSLLRDALRQPHPELVQLARQMESDEELAGLLTRWTEWLRTCQRRGEGPVDECGPHQLRAACEVFIDGLDTGWDMLSDWYQAERPETTVNYLERRDRGRP